MEIRTPASSASMDSPDSVGQGFPGAVGVWPLRPDHGPGQARLDATRFLVRLWPGRNSNRLGLGMAWGISLDWRRHQSANQFSTTRAKDGVFKLHPIKGERRSSTVALR